MQKRMELATCFPHGIPKRVKWGRVPRSMSRPFWSPSAILLWSRNTSVFQYAFLCSFWTLTWIVEKDGWPRWLIDKWSIRHQSNMSNGQYGPSLNFYYRSLAISALDGWKFHRETLLESMFPRPELMSIIFTMFNPSKLYKQAVFYYYYFLYLIFCFLKS